jgi:hypothetical protein
MKKPIVIALTAPILLSACTAENNSDLISGETAIVSITANVPSKFVTRSGGAKTPGDGSSIKYLNYYVYENDAATSQDTYVLSGKTEFTSDSKTQDIKLQLMRGKTYDVVFWATAFEDTPTEQNSTKADSESPYTYNTEGQTIEIDYSKMKANDEKMDAFYSSLPIEITGSTLAAKTTLQRPFAQLNFGTNDYSFLSDKNMMNTDNLKSSVTVSRAYSGLNLKTGEVIDGAQKQTFVENNVFAQNTVSSELEKIRTRTEESASSDVYTFPVDDYDYLAMTYLLVDGEDVVDVTVDCNDGTTTVSESYTYVPVKSNHRTNVYGSLITSETDVTISVDMNIGDDSWHLPDVWDGTTTSDLVADAEGIYTISTGSELAKLSSMVNGGETFSGKVIRLSKDIDLDNQEWTPIGNETNAFSGEFDGNGHTIYNLKITKEITSKDMVGFFGQVKSGSVKNITFKNIEITETSSTAIANNSLGGVIGCWSSPRENNIIEGITIIGDVVLTGVFGQGFSLGSLIGKITSPAADVCVNDIIVDVSSNSNLHMPLSNVPDDNTKQPYVGGVVGYVYNVSDATLTSVVKFSNIESNITVNGIRANAGGLVGYVNRGVSFTDCTCSGDVTLNLASENTSYNYKYQIGGILGCWFNDIKTAAATLTNCTYTGTLTSVGDSGTEYNEFCYSGLVGDIGTSVGTLTINGSKQ